MTIRVNDLDFTRFAFDANSDWGKCLISYLHQIHWKSNSPHTLEHYRATLQSFCSTQPLKMPQLKSREDVVQFCTTPGRRHGQGYGQPVGPGTFNNKLITLNSWYHYAANYGVQGDDGHLYPLFPYLNPAAGVGYAKYSRSVSKAMTDDELRSLFAAIGTEGLRAKRDRALLLLYLWTARRKSEILGLRRMDIEQTLIIDDKGSRMAWVYRWKGKGHARIDDIAEMPPIAAAALFDFLEASGRLATMEPDDYLFTDIRGGYDPKRPLVDSQVGWIIQYYAKKAKLERKISCHTFRHTSAKVAYAAGASIREVQQKLRHKSMATTSIYLETLISVSDPTIDRVNAKFANL